MWIWESIWIGLDQMWTQSDLIWTEDGLVAMVKELFAVCFVQKCWTLTSYFTKSSTSLMWTPVGSSDASREINVDFMEGGKPENPEKNPRNTEETFATTTTLLSNEFQVWELTRGHFQVLAQPALITIRNIKMSVYCQYG